MLKRIEATHHRFVSPVPDAYCLGFTIATASIDSSIVNVLGSHADLGLGFFFMYVCLGGGALT